jgi:hypothetical protein
MVMANLNTIREARIALMTDDDHFIETIEMSTSSLRNVTYRFDTWRKVLGDVLSSSSVQPRCFTRELKQQLYEANPTCKICNQHISELDDAAVDHIEM